MLKENSNESGWLRSRANLPTAKSHAELVSLDQKIKAQAFFSARVAETHILEKMRDVSDRFTRGEMGLGEARHQLKVFLRQNGKDDGTRGVSNLASSARLNLALNQNRAMARAVGLHRELNDPAIKQRWPYVIYRANRDGRTRDAHQALDGKVFHKDDPFLRTHWPPWEFNCRCRLENCDEETARKTGVVPMTPPEKVRVESQSGFAFDPAHAFEEFDLSSVKLPEYRTRIADQMSKKFDMSIGDDVKKIFWKKEKESPIHFEAKGMEEAQKQTKKLLPESLVDLNGIKKPESVNRLNQCLDSVKKETGLKNVKVVIADSKLPDTIPASFDEKKGILKLNPKHMNRADQWEGRKVNKNGAYEGLYSNIYKGKEVESVALHELYHAEAMEIVKKAGGKERYRKLMDAFRQARKEGFVVSIHGMTDEFEFLSETKTGKMLANVKYPDYIETMLKEFFL